MKPQQEQPQPDNPIAQFQAGLETEQRKKIRKQLKLIQSMNMQVMVMVHNLIQELSEDD